MSAEPQADAFAATEATQPATAVRSAQSTRPAKELAHADTIASGEGSSDPGLAGRQLAHHRLDELIGKGGMGAVYRAFDTALERPVAVKVLLGELSNHPDSRLRFMREARAQAKVRHPNVVPIHYVGVHDSVAFLSMHYVDGQSVADVLDQAGPLHPERAINIAMDVAAALEAGWAEGLVHRDIKPSNILIEQTGHVLLADFGLAKAVGELERVPQSQRSSSPDASLTQAGALVGTPAYMAPEQIAAATLDHRTDMYALGITLYEMLTGARPFHSDDLATLLTMQSETPPGPPRALRPDLPPRLEAVILRLLAKDPAARYGSWHEVREALDAAKSRRVPDGGRFARASALLVDLVVLAPLALLGDLIHLPALAMALGWGLMEAMWGTTVGKRLLNLRTVDAHGDKPGPLRAMARALAKMWGPLAIGAVELFGSSIYAEVGTGVVGLLWVAGLLLGLWPAKRALHDRLSATRVVYSL